MEVLRCPPCRLLPEHRLHCSMGAASWVLARISSHVMFHQHGQLMLLNEESLGFQAVTGLRVAGTVCAQRGCLSFAGTR